MRDFRLPRLFTAALLTLAPLAPLQAAHAAGTDDVVKCLGIVDATARLACYDRTVGALRQLTPAAPQAPATPQAPAAPAVAAPVSREQTFGSERIARAPDASVPEEAESITAKLKEVKQVTVDRYSFTLDNGQVWTMVVARSIANAKEGKTVQIEKGLFGSYSMSIDGVTGIIKVRRTK